MARTATRSAPFGRWLNSPPPAIAVEVSPEHVVAARLDRRALRIAQSALQPLAQGAVHASATEANILQPDVVRNALRLAAEKVGGSGREVILLVPDLTARVSLVEFDQVPSRHEELVALVRFRLRKTLPFDADRAAIAAQRVATDSTTVLVAVADRERLDEYENCVEAMGVRPVVVMPAGLAALASSGRFDGGALLLRADASSLTSAFGWEGVLRFYRVIEAETAHPVYDDVYPSIAFYRDFVEARGSTGGQARIAVSGLTSDLYERLRQEVNWAEIQAAQPDSSLNVAAAESEALLAVAGALAHHA